MKKRLILLLAICLASIQLTYSQTQMLWSKPPTPYDANNFNQNQYDCPIWIPKHDLFPLDRDVHSTIVRDFNNDGYCDVFFSFWGDESESLPFILYLYNPISGLLENESDLILNNIGQPFNRKAVSADFNGDGILDVVAVSHPEGVDEDLSYLDVVLSNETGWEQFNLDAPSQSNFEGYYHGVAVGDIDNDGDVDLMVAAGSNQGQEEIVSFLNDGSGNFSKNFPLVNFSVDNKKYAYTIELEDIDLDGCLDVIYWGGEGARLVYGNCDGTFGGNIQEMQYGDFGIFMDFDFMDFDNDGDKDLILTETTYEVGEWQLVFLRNNGIDNGGEIIFENITQPITTALKEQDFYLDESSRYWVAYIQLIDLNNDGILDIIKANPFEGEWENSFYPQNWVLFGNANLNFDYVNYPLISSLNIISFDRNETEVNISYETVYLRNVPNPFNTEMIMVNLRGEINEWVVYYSQSPFGDKTLEGIERAVISDVDITKEFLGNNTFRYTFNFQPVFGGSDDIYARVTYVDEYGVENVLSEQIQFLALGLDDELLSEGLKLFPNPVSNILSVESKLELTKVEIYSILGQKIKEIDFGFNSISTKNLSKGIYIIRIYSEKGHAVRKLIKQ